MKNILSIDGGGIRGLIPVSCLVELESREGKPCREIFDMVAGTSTGAVIAAGLALGVSARGLLALYRELARNAFEKLPLWEILANLGNHRYSNEFIASTLLDLHADTPLNSLPIDVMITAKNVNTGRTDFFVRDGPGNTHTWGSLLLSDAVLASIAAPTYFPAHTVTLGDSSHTWVDGGVGIAGNPCYQAAVEALHYGDGSYVEGEVNMLAFGTGRSPHSIDAHEANILQWGLWVLDELLEEPSEWQTFVTRREYGDSKRIDFRRYQLDLAPDVMESLEVAVPEGMDVTAIELDSLWAIDLLTEIGRAFADKIDFDDPDGLELPTGQGWGAKAE
jgi:patatin-like phospholipase/acyl hydrolase